MNWLEALASTSTTPPRTRARAAHDEGQRAPAVVVDLDAELAQRVEHRTHRPLPGVGVAVERHVAVGQRGDRRYEAHDRARQAAVDGGRAAHRPGVTTQSVPFGGAHGSRSAPRAPSRRRPSDRCPWRATGCGWSSARRPARRARARGWSSTWTRARRRSRRAGRLPQGPPRSASPSHHPRRAPRLSCLVGDHDSTTKSPVAQRRCRVPG